MALKEHGIYALIFAQFIIGLASANPIISSPPENVVFHFHLFEGEADLGTKQTEVSIFSEETESKMSIIKAVLDNPESEITTATIDYLLEKFNLNAINEYFAFSIGWEGKRGTYSNYIDQRYHHFRLMYSPVRISPERLELGFTLYYGAEDPVKFEERVKKKKEGKFERPDVQMKKIIETKFFLNIDGPILASIPAGEKTFFLLVYARRKGETPKSVLAMPIVPPKELDRVIPAYPEELRNQGIQGTVELRVVIDESGSASEIKVEKQLHPYLDFAAVQAIRQSKFEPAVQDGKPIVASSKVVVNFDPVAYRIIEENAANLNKSDSSKAIYSGKTLPEILYGSAEYCRKLVKSVFDFICEERIKEIHYNFETDPKWDSIAVGSSVTGEITKIIWIPRWDPKKTQKNDYLCDFLYVRKREKSEERRIVLRDNGQRMPDRNKLLEEKRFTALDPVLAAVRILGRDAQNSYFFSFVKMDSVGGSRSFVLQAIPKPGNTWGVESAKIWIAQNDYRVLRIEIQGVPVEGYEDVLKDCIQFRVRPYLVTTHVYGNDKNGILFPTSTTIRVEYPKRGDFNKDRVLKLKIDMAYDKYKYFVVKTEKSIKG